FGGETARWELLRQGVKQRQRLLGLDDEAIERRPHGVAHGKHYPPFVIGQQLIVNDVLSQVYRDELWRAAQQRNSSKGLLFANSETQACKVGSLDLRKV